MTQSLYHKYIVQKEDGSQTDPEAVYFVLRLDTDPAARAAASAYASACKETNPKLAADLLALVDEIVDEIVDRIERRTS